MPDDIENGLSTNMLEPARLEQTFLTKMQEPAILIYQLLPDKELADRRFMAMEYLQSKGLPVERTYYEPIYAMTVSTAETRPEQLLEDVFYIFNMNRPADFKGHSLSVSDIVALKIHGAVSFHYVDSFGFQRLDGFLPDHPLKNAEMTAEDDYGMIDGIINNGKNLALEPPTQTEEQLQQAFPSILERLNSPLPARTSHEKPDPKKTQGMEL